MTIDVRLADAAFDPGAEITAFAAAHPGAGGVVSFLGQVRGGGVLRSPEAAGAAGAGDAQAPRGLEEVTALELQHYPPLTLPGMRALAEAAAMRWALAGLTIIHRIGVMAPGEAIVLVIAAARHRRDAFAAADYAMDHLKSDAWFWKREQRGCTWRWVEPRPEDHADLARW